MPQGSILRLLSFRLQTEDVPEVCPSNVVHQINADDAVVYLSAINKWKAVTDHQLSWLRLLS